MLENSPEIFSYIGMPAFYTYLENNPLIITPPALTELYFYIVCAKFWIYHLYVAVMPDWLLLCLVYTESTILQSVIVKFW